MVFGLLSAQLHNHSPTTQGSESIHLAPRKDLEYIHTALFVVKLMAIFLNFTLENSNCSLAYLRLF